MILNIICSTKPITKGTLCVYAFGQNVSVCIFVYVNTLMTGSNANTTATEILPPSSWLQENKKWLSFFSQFHLRTSSWSWCAEVVHRRDYFPPLSLSFLSLFSLSSSHLLLLLRAVESDWRLPLRIKWLLKPVKRASHSYHGNWQRLALRHAVWSS